MREFVTAAKEVSEEQEGRAGVTPFVLDGTQCVARRPKDGQVAILLATTSRQMKETDRIAGVINFFTSVLDDKSYTYIVNRLLDVDDDLGLSDVEDIMMFLVEEWTGRPTKSPSGSTPSQPDGGQNSTPSTPALT